MELAKAEKVNENLDDTPDRPEHCAKTDIFAKFEKDLTCLINKHSLENTLEMPDFVMAKLLVNVLNAIVVSHARNNMWHEMNAYPDDYKKLKESAEALTTSSTERTQ